MNPNMFCEICSITFFNKSLFDAHLSSEHGKPTFKEKLIAHQARRKVKKFGGDSSNEVGTICPLPVEIGSTNLPKIGQKIKH